MAGAGQQQKMSLFWAERNIQKKRKKDWRRISTVTRSRRASQYRLSVRRQFSETWVVKTPPRRVRSWEEQDQDCSLAKPQSLNQQRWSSTVPRRQPSSVQVSKASSEKPCCLKPRQSQCWQYSTKTTAFWRNPKVLTSNVDWVWCPEIKGPANAGQVSNAASQKPCCLKPRLSRCWQYSTRTAFWRNLHRAWCPQIEWSANAGQVW